MHQKAEDVLQRREMDRESVQFALPVYVRKHAHLLVPLCLFHLHSRARDHEKT